MPTCDSVAARRAAARGQGGASGCSRVRLARTPSSSGRSPAAVKCLAAARGSYGGSRLVVRRGPAAGGERAQSRAGPAAPGVPHQGARSIAQASAWRTRLRVQRRRQRVDPQSGDACQVGRLLALHRQAGVLPQPGQRRVARRRGQQRRAGLQQGQPRRRVRQQRERQFRDGGLRPGEASRSGPAGPRPGTGTARCRPGATASGPAARRRGRAGAAARSAATARPPARGTRRTARRSGR